METTKKSKMYKANTKKDIDKMFETKQYTGSFDTHLVSDTINYMIGGEDSLKEMPIFESRLFDTKRETFTQEQRDEDIDKQEGDFIKQQQLLKELPYDLKTDEETPLEAACKVISLYTAAQNRKGERAGKSSDTESSVTGSNAGMVKEIRKIQEEITYLEKEGNEYVKKMITGKEDEINAFNVNKITGKDALMLKYLSVLEDFKGKIGTSKIRTKKKSVDAKRTHVAPMQEMGQMFDANILDFALPGLQRKLAAMDLQVREKYQYEKSKQTLVMLVDDSGSMSNREKIACVNAILLNRLDAVRKGEAILYINTFEEELDTCWRKIETKKECDILWKQRGSYFTYGRGGTNVQRAVQEAILQITTGELKIKGGKVIELEDKMRPQIVVVNDGQDSVDKKYRPAITTHGFILGQENAGMKSMCSNSRGVYHRFF